MKRTREQRIFIVSFLAPAFLLFTVFVAMLADLVIAL